MAKIIDSGFCVNNCDKSMIYRDILMQIKREEAETTINDFKIKTRISLDSDYDYQLNQFFFKVHYSISWYCNHYYNIDKTKINRYDSYITNVLFNYIDAKVIYTKQTKQKVKNQIKKILDNVIVNDNAVYQNHNTVERPNEQDYTAYSSQIENKLNGLNV